MNHDSTILRIGYLSTVYHTSFILKGTGILHDYHVRAEWTLFPSGPDMIHAMQEGSIDIGYIGLPPVIIGIDRGVALRCIAGGQIEGTVLIAGDPVKALQECSGLQDFFSQFQGKAIGCPPRGSIHDVIIHALLEESGMDDITVTHYPWADFIPDALTRGEIAAAAGTPALAVTARRYAGAKIIMPPSSVWPYNPSYGIVLAGEMPGDKDILFRFLRPHEEACERIRHDPRGCAHLVSAVTGMVDPEFVWEAYRISPKYCAALTGEYIASTMRFVRTLHKTGYIQKTVEQERMFDLSLIAEVHSSPAHYESGLFFP